MRNINHVVIAGNLTRNPELRRTQSGTAVLTIGVAVNESKRNPQTGNWEDYANFIDCVLFGERADKLAEMLEKGQKICIDGKLHYSSWERDGQKRSKVEVLIDQIELLSRKADTQKQAEPEQRYGDSYYDSEIPF